MTFKEFQSDCQYNICSGNCGRSDGRCEEKNCPIFKKQNMPQSAGKKPPKPIRSKPDKIELGDLVKDTLTNLEGIAIVKLKHITGCIQFKVQPQLNEKNGYLGDGKIVDRSRLIIIKKQVWNQ